MSKTRYQNWVEIGHGAYGTVYVAWDLAGCNKVAIKSVMLPAFQEKQGARVLERLNHTACPHLIDFFEQDGRFYIVMSYFEAHSLPNEAILRANEVRKMAQTMLAVLEQLWQLGLTYNDFKPSNILKDEENHFYLVDFGSVLPSHSQQMRFGSPAYASPEYLEGRQIDWRSDLYSLARTMNVLCIKPDKSLEWWIQKALRKDPSARFRTFKEAKWTLNFHLYYLGLGIVAFVLLLMMQPILKNAYYDYCLDHRDFLTCTKIDASRKEAYVAYLESHDVSEIKTWIVLDQMGLKNVMDESFILYCSDLLCALETDFSWQLQMKILDGTNNQEAKQRLNLLQNQNVEAYERSAKNRNSRLFLYQYCLNATIPINESIYQWIDDDPFLSEDEVFIFTAKMALKWMDVSKMTDCYESIQIGYLKAELAYTIFKLGTYDKGWLHQAKEVLLQDELDDNGRNLLKIIEKEIEQWGENA